MFVAPPRPLAWLTALACLMFLLPLARGAVSNGEEVGEEIVPIFDPETGKRIIPNERCLKCHGDESEKTDTRDDGSIVEIYVRPHQLQASVHGNLMCTDCHTNITRTPHRDAPSVGVGCVECHQQTWAEHKDDPSGDYARLGVVVEQIDSFMTSVHAQPNKYDQSHTNATCYDCHDAHNIGALGSQQRADHRLANPEVCGRCHEEQKEQFLASAHGRALTEWKDPSAAVCSDCHASHDIASPEGDAVQLALTQNCGSCHEDAKKTYLASYHGQVNRLGYTNIAKCFDCHGGHGVSGEDDPTSSIHRDNRLETCQQCHEDASQRTSRTIPGCGSPPGSCSCSSSACSCSFGPTSSCGSTGSIATARRARATPTPRLAKARCISDASVGPGASCTCCLRSAPWSSS